MICTDKKTLTTENIKDGLVVTQPDHPEYGNWTIRLGRNGWEVGNGRGTKMLGGVNEYCFWAVVA